MMENENIEARQAILLSVREHLAASKRFDAAAPHPQTAQPRARLDLSKDDRSLLEVFRQSLEAVAGHCLIVQDETKAALAIQRIIDDSKARCVAVSDAPIVKNILAQVKSDAKFLDAPSQAELFDCDLGVTGAQWAIAETGTMVLQSERERNRLASLVPPVHVAIIRRSRIRRTMSEILDLIQNDDIGLSRAVTFITGPSRTSDIELTLAIGVHGPGELHVVIIDDTASAV